MRNVPERHRGALTRRFNREEAAERKMRATENKLVRSYAAANPGYVFVPGEFGSESVACFERDNGVERVVRTKRSVGQWTVPVVETHQSGTLVEVAACATPGLRSYGTVRDWVDDRDAASNQTTYTLIEAEDDEYDHDAARAYFAEVTSDSEATIEILRGTPVVEHTEDGPQTADFLEDPDTDDHSASATTTPSVPDAGADGGASYPVTSRYEVEHETAVATEPDATPVIDEDAIDDRTEELNGVVETIYRALCYVINRNGGDGVEKRDLLAAYYDEFDGEVSVDQADDAITEILMKGLAYESAENTYKPI